MADIKADTENSTAPEQATKGVSRREFITGLGGLGIGAVLGGGLVKGFLLPDQVFAIPASEGYILVDTKKCAGCTSCMLACSLVHEGKESLSLSRIQVTQDPFGKFPGDVEQAQCHQCPYPACVDACPTGANHVDAANGNVRTVDASKCIGCERCVNACPFTPSRALWNFEDKHAQKCDLCANAPYWKEKGGPGGKQACVTVCPVHAITFTGEIPVQSDAGYDVNLRKNSGDWKRIGLSVD
ncbi:MAG: 4Fe-4S dicluster domain-containing protein [Actinomycetia bacterium]|nr:4Fe-4S dicluster domain-containing protein [Actinomycetes bacterium]